MKRSTNFRLSEEALQLLDAEATRQGSTRTAIVEMLARTLRRGARRHEDNAMQQRGPSFPSLRFPYMDFHEPICVKLTNVRIGASYHPDLDIEEAEYSRQVAVAHHITIDAEEIIWTFEGTGFFAGRHWEVSTGVIARAYDGTLTHLGHILLALNLYTAEELSTTTTLDPRDPRQAIGATVSGTLEPTSKSGVEYSHATTSLTILPPAVAEEVMHA